MVQSFDEWYKEAKKLNDDGFSAKDFFEAGQQSKQDEVNELKKRIDDALKNISYEQWCDEYGDYQTPVFKLIEILKGN